MIDSDELVVVPLGLTGGGVTEADWELELEVVRRLSVSVVMLCVVTKLFVVAL